MKRVYTCAWIALAGLALWAWLCPGKPEVSGPLRFRVQVPRLRETADAPVYGWEFLTRRGEVASVHVASLCALPDGALAAVWYGGTVEGAPDTAVFFTRQVSGLSPIWSPPRPIVDAGTATRELRRYIRKVGNPLLFSDPEGTLHLLYVGITLGGWSTSSLNLKISTDGGETWGDASPLFLSPFFNLSELVRGKPVTLENGGFAIPIYHEFLGKFPEILWLETVEAGAGPLATKTRISWGRRYIQPSLVPLGPEEGLAFLRDGSEHRATGLARTRDAGRTWDAPVALGLPNPDAGLDALRLESGALLVACNGGKTGRESLILAVSKDEGLSWTRMVTLEEEKGEEFSYPFLLRGREGVLHLVYTWKRRDIKHVWFNEAWLATGGGGLP